MILDAVSERELGDGGPGYEVDPECQRDEEGVRPYVGMIADLRGAEALVRDLGAGRADEGALVSVFRSDGPALVGLARLLLDDPGQAEEVVQEAFVRTYVGWARVRNRDDPLPYVRRAVMNLARSGLRRRRTERGLRVERPLEVPSAEATAVEQARDREVAAAVAALPRRQRECVVLRFFLDCSLGEIAAALGISDGAVKQHLHRAIATLERALGEAEEEDV
jgi:RNA polymerase sigma-70 factor (sigma-E family)